MALGGSAFQSLLLLYDSSSISGGRVGIVVVGSVVVVSVVVVVTVVVGWVVVVVVVVVLESVELSIVAVLGSVELSVVVVSSISAFPFLFGIINTAAVIAEAVIIKLINAISNIYFLFRMQSNKMFGFFGSELVDMISESDDGEVLLIKCFETGKYQLDYTQLSCFRREALLPSMEGD